MGDTAQESLASARSTLSESTSRVQVKHDEVGDNLKKLTHTINNVLTYGGPAAAVLGGPAGIAAWGLLAPKISANAGQVAKVVNDLLELVKKILDEGIPVVSLVERAFDWLKLVQQPVAGMSDTAGTYVINLNNWSGPAASAYAQRLGSQTKQMDAFADAASGMATWLGDLAASNADYILALFQPLVDVAAALLTAVAEAESIVKIPTALSNCFDVINIAVTSLYEALKNAIGAAMVVVNKGIEATATQNSLGTTWPQMVNK